MKRLIITAFFFNLVFIPICSISQIHFTENIVQDIELNEPSCFLVEDFDLDGDMDVIVGARTPKNLVLYINTGNANYSHQVIINSDSSFVNSLSSIDFNNDGALDILATHYHQYDYRLKLYINDGLGNFNSFITITDTIETVYHTDPCDLDLDGDMDFLMSSIYGDNLYWVENKGNMNFDFHQVNNKILFGPKRAYFTDLNDDSHQDILVAQTPFDTIFWYQNDGNQNFGSRIFITDELSYVNDFCVTDFDGDGDKDIATASNSSVLAWFENDGNENFVRHSPDVDSTLTGINVIAKADLDGNGSMDLVSSSGNNGQLKMYLNDGLGNFTSYSLTDDVTTQISYVETVDMDNDGDFDIVAGSLESSLVSWYENDGNGNFAHIQYISRKLFSAKHALASDMDNDGDADIIASSIQENKIVLYENNGTGLYEPQQIISDTAEWVDDIFLHDMNNDGWVDIVAAIRFNNGVYWFQNTGNLTFNSPQAIDSIEFSSAICVTDMDNNGTPDIVYGGSLPGFFTNNLFVSLNDGNGNFTRIDTTSNWCVGINSITSGDIDNDGDNDIIYTSSYTNEIIMHLNNNSGILGDSVLVSTDCLGLNKVKTADLNQDGFTDLIAFSCQDKTLSWFQNNTQGMFGQRQIIKDSVFCDGFTGFTIGDFDHDNDSDIILGAKDEQIMHWFENDGNGNFTQQNGLSFTQGCSAVDCYDIDGDSDLDVVCADRIGLVSTIENSLFIHIKENPASNVYCSNEDIQFVINAPSAINYQWQIDNGSGFIDLTNNFVFSGINNDTLILLDNFMVPGGSQFRCRLSNNTDTILSDAFQINFLPAYEEVVSEEICEGDSVDFEGSYYNVSGIFSFYYQTVDGCDSIIHLDLIVNPLPVVTLYPFTNDTMCIEEGVIPVPLSNPTGGYYQGSGVNGLEINLNIAGLGTHELIYTYTDPVTSCFNSDTISYVIVECNGINEPGNKIKIHPNPVKSVLYIDGLIGDEEIVLRNTLGVLNRFSAKNQNFIIEMHNLPGGIYFLEISRLDKTSTYQIIKLN